jgi:hypothetical protein
MILAGNELRCHNGHESKTLKGIKVKSVSALAGKLQENPPEASFQDSSGSSSEAGMVLSPAAINKEIEETHAHMIYDIYIYKYHIRYKGCGRIEAPNAFVEKSQRMYQNIVFFLFS